MGYLYSSEQPFNGYHYLLLQPAATTYGNMLEELKREVQLQDSNVVTLLLLQRWRNAAGEGNRKGVQLLGVARASEQPPSGGELPVRPLPLLDLSYQVFMSFEWFPSSSTQ